MRRDSEARLAHDIWLVQVDIVECAVDHLGGDLLLGSLAGVSGNNVDGDDG